MRKITSEEFDELSKYRKPRKNKSLWAREISHLKVGQGLLIRKEEWKLKSPPIVYVGNYKRRGIFEVTIKTLESGWAILRIK